MLILTYSKTVFVSKRGLGISNQSRIAIYKYFNNQDAQNYVLYLVETGLLIDPIHRFSQVLTGFNDLI